MQFNYICLFHKAKTAICLKCISIEKGAYIEDGETELGVVRCAM